MKQFILHKFLLIRVSMKLHKHPTVKDLLIANKTVKKLKAVQKSEIFLPETGEFDYLKFDVYCDAAHANFLMTLQAVKHT